VSIDRKHDELCPLPHMPVEDTTGPGNPCGLCELIRRVEARTTEWWSREAQHRVDLALEESRRGEGRHQS
jgi:hypothetical protein